jgi:hypothetical protein
VYGLPQAGIIAQVLISKQLHKAEILVTLVVANQFHPSWQYLGNTPTKQTSTI